MRLALAGLLLCACNATAGGDFLEHHADGRRWQLSLGARDLDRETWDRTDEQYPVGVHFQFDLGDAGGLVTELGFQASEENRRKSGTGAGLSGRLLELDLGLRAEGTLAEGRFMPYVGLGIAGAHGRLKEDGSGDFSDFGPGAYAQAGILITEAWGDSQWGYLGLELRWLEAELDLRGEHDDAGYRQIALVWGRTF